MAEGQGPFLLAALYQVSCRMLGSRLANMQPDSRPYAWPCFYRIRGVHAGQWSPVGGHLLPLAPFGHALPLFAVVGPWAERPSRHTITYRVTRHIHVCVWVCQAQVDVVWTGERESVRGGYHLPFTWVYSICGGRCPSGGALGASPGSAGSSPVAAHQWAGPPIDPFEYWWRRALLQVCGATIRFLFGAVVFLGAKRDETSTRSAGTGGGAGCCRGGWFQRCPLESSTCMGPRSRSPRESNPRTGRLKTTALAIGPSMSLTSFLALPLGGGCSRGGVVLAAVVSPVGVCVRVC